MTEDDIEFSTRKRGKSKGNILPFHGSEKTMNLNNMVYTNIISSPYFKNDLFSLKTYHEVVDEIYYKVSHLEPWERGSRNLSNQVGMCGGVRGVGTGGIVSTAYCLLYKLFTLRLTRKQVNGLLSHTDSPYIRAIGFMYIRYTQPPTDLWEWLEQYLDDDEDVDVRAGGGQVMTIGELCETMLIKLEWFSTYFPRIPVPIQKEIMSNVDNHRAARREQKLSITHGSTIEPNIERRSSGHSSKYDSSRFGKEEAHDGRTHSRDWRSRIHGEARDISSHTSKSHRDDRNDRSSSRDKESNRSRARKSESSHRHERSRHRKRSRSRNGRRNRSKERSRSRSKEKTHKQVDNGDHSKSKRVRHMSRERGHKRGGERKQGIEERERDESRGKKREKHEDARHMSSKGISHGTRDDAERDVKQHKSTEISCSSFREDKRKSSDKEQSMYGFENRSSSGIDRCKESNRNRRSNSSDCNNTTRSRRQ